MDGAFKSACKMWKQKFVWMIKVRGYWIPVVWAWLPDKAEQSYKVFIHLVQEKLKELNIGFNIKSVSSDFELNIHKSIDQMLIGVEILGCFFHLQKTFFHRVEKKGMKTRYDQDLMFRHFNEACGALAHLPKEDLKKE